MKLIIMSVIVSSQYVHIISASGSGGNITGKYNLFLDAIQKSIISIIKDELKQLNINKVLDKFSNEHKKRMIALK